MLKFLFALLVLSALVGCYAGEEVVFTPENPSVDGGSIPLSDSILALDAYRESAQWNFEHTYGQQCTYRLQVDAREKTNDAFPGPGIDTIFSIERVRYRMLTTDLGPKMTMRIQTHRKYDLLVNLAISDYFSNSLRISDSVESTYDNKSVRYHDTVLLANHVLYNVYEIASTSAYDGRLRGLFYSTELGVMGFYENRETNYWARVD